MTATGIEVSEMRGQTLPEVEDAAMRFAAGQDDEARALLEQAVAAHPGQRRPWLMLLDLLGLANRWGDYDASLARYTAAFGADPPRERERARREADLPEALRVGGDACVALHGTLDAKSRALVARLHAAAARHALVRLEVSRLASVEAAGAGLLHEAFSAVLDAGSGVMLTGHDNLLRLLRACLDGQPGERHCWDLLLLVHRLAGDQASFERDALQATLATDRPAPEWDPLLVPQPPPASAGSERRAQPRYSGREAFALTCRMTGAHDPQLDALARFAQDREYINLDLSRLDRLDFACAVQLANQMLALASAGRTVRLLRPNALVAALLDLLHLDAITIIVTPPT